MERQSNIRSWLKRWKYMKDFLAGIKQAQNRTTYYAPNQLAQMRPNPRWQQQGGRGQGERERLYDPRIYDAQTVRSFVLFSLFFASSLVLLGGFQGIPSSLRQPGPRANLRQMTPNSSSQGPRGVFSNTTTKSFALLLPATRHI